MNRVGTLAPAGELGLRGHPGRGAVEGALVREIAYYGLPRAEQTPAVRRVEGPQRPSPDAGRPPGAGRPRLGCRTSTGSSTSRSSRPTAGSSTSASRRCAWSRTTASPTSSRPSRRRVVLRGELQVTTASAPAPWPRPPRDTALRHRAHHGSTTPTAPVPPAPAWSAARPTSSTRSARTPSTPRWRSPSTGSCPRPPPAAARCSTAACSRWSTWQWRLAPEHVRPDLQRRRLKRQPAL
jgi:hypothetical protein